MFFFFTFFYTYPGCIHKGLGYRVHDVQDVHPSRGAGVPRAGHGSGVEDRGGDVTGVAPE